MAIYQARFMRYLKDRGILDTQGRKVWAFMGDGEMDEPESLGAISLAGREKLDNLIFVINCNLQRLDGPVRGNGKIIQELEGGFPRRRLERDQGDLGLVLGPAHRARQERAAAEAHGRVRRRRIPGVQGERRRVRAQALLRQVSGAARDGRQHVRRRHLAAEPRRPRPAQGLRGVRGGDEAQGPADGDPRQDDQGLWHGRVRRRPEHHPPAEEDGHVLDQGVPRPLQGADSGRQARRSAVLQAARRRARDAVHEEPHRGAGRLAAGAPAQGRPARSAARSPRSKRS